MSPIRKLMTTSSPETGLSSCQEPLQPLAGQTIDAHGKPYQPNELLTIARVCDEYGFGRTTVYELLGNGTLPAKVIGKRGTRIRRGDIDDLVKSLPPYRRPSST